MFPQMAHEVEPKNISSQTCLPQQGQDVQRKRRRQESLNLIVCTVAPKYIGRHASKRMNIPARVTLYNGITLQMNNY